MTFEEFMNEVPEMPTFFTRECVDCGGDTLTLNSRGDVQCYLCEHKQKEQNRVRNQKNPEEESALRPRV
jgi:hypothetical protein